MKSNILLISLLALPRFSFAQYVNPLSCGTVEQCIKLVLDVVIQVGVLVLVVMIIWSGYLFVTAQGNVDQIKRAKSSLKWAVLGGALLLGAWALSVAIGDTITAMAP